MTLLTQSHVGLGPIPNSFQLELSLLIPWLDKQVAGVVLTTLASEEERHEQFLAQIS